MFDLEEDLVSVLRSTARQLLPRLTAARDLLIEELLVGSCIPDLIYVETRAAKVKLLPPDLSHIEAEILASLFHCGAAEPKDLAARLLLRESRLLEAIGRLSRETDVLRVWGDTLVEVRPRRVPKGLRITAIEAKLTDWKTAFRQAKSYQRFANHSYIALPAPLVERNEDLVHATRRSGLGLIAVDTTKARITSPAHYQKPTTGDRMWLLSRISRQFL